MSALCALFVSELCADGWPSLTDGPVLRLGRGRSGEPTGSESEEEDKAVLASPPVANKCSTVPLGGPERCPSDTESTKEYTNNNRYCTGKTILETKLRTIQCTSLPEKLSTDHGCYQGVGATKQSAYAHLQGTTEIMGNQRTNINIRDREPHWILTETKYNGGLNRFIINLLMSWGQ